MFLVLFEIFLDFDSLVFYLTEQLLYTSSVLGTLGEGK